MGQKVNPVGLRIGFTQGWKSRWFAEKEYPKLLEEDVKIRSYLEKKLLRAGISKIEVEKATGQVKIDIYTARPGVVIGKKGAEVDILRSDIEKMTGKEVQINIQEVLRPEIDATLVAQNVAEQLEARVSFRRAMKRAVSAALKSGAEGVKISCSGRLGGAEMARTEWYREGRVPLQTLRADVDYGLALARTKFGSIGVKTWIYKGDIIPSMEEKEEEKEKGKEKERLIPKVVDERRIRKEEVKEEAKGKEKKPEEKAQKEAERVEVKGQKERKKPAKKEKKLAKETEKKTEVVKKKTSAKKKTEAPKKTDDKKKKAAKKKT